MGVKQSIFVQTQHNLEENRWVLGMAEQTDWLVGVVGWVDLASDACEEQLLEFKDHPKFVGIRHVTQDEPDEDFIIRPEILRGLKILEKHSAVIEASALPYSERPFTCSGRSAIQLAAPSIVASTNSTIHG